MSSSIMINLDDRAVSNVLSALLVTLIIVLAVGLVAAVALGSSGDFGQDTPLVDFDYDVSNESVSITHSGGDPVAFDQVTVIFEGTDGNETRFGLEDAINISEDSDGNFETGEEVSHNHSVRETAWIEITIIHESSNSIISDAPNTFRVSTESQGASSPPMPSPTTSPTATPTPEPDDPPNATIDNINDTSQCSNTNPSGKCNPNAQTNLAEFTVDWSASDDNSLSNGTVRLIDSDGNPVDIANLSASGTDAAGTVTLSEDGGWDEEYTIELIVEDSSEQTSSDSETDTADGTDP